MKDSKHPLIDSSEDNNMISLDLPDQPTEAMPSIFEIDK